MSTEPTQQLDDGGPAFPCQIDSEGGWYNAEANGMSLRDWLAGKALQGLLVNYDTHGLTVPQCVGLALDAADAMLAARKAVKTAEQAFEEIQVRKSAADYSEYLSSRFKDGATSGTFIFRGHRWRYKWDSFDDEGEFAVLERPLKGGVK